METLQVQSQIRHNAEELSSYLTDITKWETTMKKTETTKLSNKINKLTSNHEKEEKNGIKIDTKTRLQGVENNSQVNLTTLPTRAIIPKSDCEEKEREIGNEAYRREDLQAAIRSYTRCIYLQNQNIVAFSNRAAAYLKLKEFTRAEQDCSCALSIDPNHFKSRLRRACARNAVCKHRLAYQDLIVAINIDPCNSECSFELKKTRDMIRSSVYKAPSTALALEWKPIDTHDNIATEDNFRESPKVLYQVHGPNLPLSLL